MVLKIKNPNYVPAEDLDLTGEIIFGELDAATGQIPVSYEGPEEVVLTATINGEPVEIVDGMITLPGYGEYEVYVYANAEGYKEEPDTFRKIGNNLSRPEYKFLSKYTWCFIRHFTIRIKRYT